MKAPSKINHYLLWALLILLTAILLLWPVHYQYKYEAVQALSIFDNLFAFGGLYILWMSILFLLANQIGLWRNALLVCLFSLVYNGFWLINCPYIAGASFDPGGVAYVNYILDRGRIASGVPQWGYFEFPITPIFGAALSQIAGLDIFTASKVFLVFGSLTLALSVYIFYFKSLGNSEMSFLGVIIAMLGSVFMISLAFFRPGTMGFLLIFAPFLVLIGLHKDKIGRTLAEAILIILIFLTVVCTHFISSVAFFFILLGIYLYQRLNKREIISLNMIVLASVLSFSWWIYQSLYTTGFIVTSFAAFLAEPMGISLTFALRHGEALLGGQVPVWASGVRTFWLILLYVLPSVIVIKAYASRLLFKKREAVLGKEMGALLGIGILLIIMTIADQGANRSVGQFFLFSTFFMPLILLTFLSQGKFFNRNSKKVLLCSAIFIILLSFPTFLAHHPSVNTQIVYNREHALFLFLKANYGKDKEMNIFTDLNTSMPRQYYLPDANHYLLPYAPDYVQTKAEFLQKLPQYMEWFSNTKGDSYFIYSPRISHFSYMQLGVPKDHPIWGEVLQDLEGKNKIYDNGFNWIVVDIVLRRKH